MQSSRRQFFKIAAVTAAVGTQLLVFGQQVWAQTLELVDMTKKKRKDKENEAAVAMLTGMGYVADAKAAKPARTDKGTMAAANQHCNNCILMEEKYLDVAAPGKCQIVQGVLVNALGYCNTYNPNPKSKMNGKKA